MGGDMTTTEEVVVYQAFSQIEGQELSRGGAEGASPCGAPETQEAASSVDKVVPLRNRSIFVGLVGTAGPYPAAARLPRTKDLPVAASTSPTLWPFIACFQRNLPR